MGNIVRPARLLAAALVLGLIVASGCTPEEIRLFESLTPAQQREVIQHIQRESDKFAHVLSDAQLARLRACESSGRYDAVSRTGRFRGAYQFDRLTWNDVARRHYPQLAGIDPAAARPYDQDRMARALWSERGRQPWPECGRRV